MLSPIALTMTSLWSTDCATWDSKMELEMAWQSADRYFSACVQRVATETNSTEVAAASLLAVTDCAEYINAPDVARYQRQWGYLAALELQQECSGWCTRHV